MMIELTYLIAALAVGKLGGLDGHALHGHGRLFESAQAHAAGQRQAALACEHVRCTTRFGFQQGGRGRG